MVVADALANRDLAEFAALAADAPPAGEEAIYGALLDALAAAFAALADPDCMRFVGPIVPGATMARGARVPGTSLELEPIAAAFCIGVAACWRGGADPVRENLGALLALLDFSSRRAHDLACPPPLIGALLTGLGRAARIQATLEQEAAYPVGADAARLAVRVASATVAARLLGGDVARTALAATHAWLDGVPPAGHPRARPIAARAAWAAGDATSRGLRCALLALATGTADGTEACVSADPASAAAVARIAAASPPPVDAGDALARFAASLGPLFGGRRSAAILKCVTDRDAFAATPINEFAALVVRNA